MAVKNHTLESSSAQENSPLFVQLIVSEIFVAAPKGIGCIALSVLCHEYEPSILLQGEWLRTMGFDKGQRVQVAAMSNLLVVEHVDKAAKPNDKLDFNKSKFSLLKSFKDELDAIKAECAASKQGEGRDLNEAILGGRHGSEKGDTNGDEKRNNSLLTKGRKTGSENGRKSEGESVVLTEVDDGDNRDNRDNRD